MTDTFLETTLDAPVPGSSWSAVDTETILAGLIDGTLQRLTPTVGAIENGDALFYAGKVNGIAGESGSGKSWTALAACADEVHVGRSIIYIDLEDDAAGILGRLLDMNVRPDAIRGHFVYVRPDERFDVLAADELFRLIDRTAPTLVVIDSTGEALALDGAKPNEDDDVARWFRRLPTSVAARGPAVVVLDHVTKTDDAGLWPIGSQRKRAAISGAQYMQRTVKPFAKGQPGRAVLVCAKDRHGSYRAGQRVAELAVDPVDDRVKVRVVAAEHQPRTQDETFRPTGYMERVSRALELSSDPMTFNDLVERCGKKPHVRKAVDVLVHEGYVTTSPGPRNATLHVLARAFRESDDTGTQSTTEPTPERLVTGSGSYSGDPGPSHFTGTRDPVGTQWDPVGTRPRRPVYGPAITDPCPDCGESLKTTTGLTARCRDTHQETNT